MIKKAVFGGVLILIAGIYFCPVTNYTFAETYQKEDEVSLSLKKFLYIHYLCRHQEKS